MNVDISPAEALAIHEALFHEAARLRRMARNRDAAGPDWARYREACRANAACMGELARRIGRQFGFTSPGSQPSRDGRT